MQSSKDGNANRHERLTPIKTLSTQQDVRSNLQEDHNDKVGQHMVSINETQGVEVNQTSACAVTFGDWPDGTKEKVWLTSFPRSGNTWTRHLLEIATGIYTGSFYSENSLYKQGFKGEIDQPGQGQKLVYKCHSFKKTYMFGILLIRNLYDSMVSLYAYNLTGMMGSLNLELFRNSTDFSDMVKTMHERWRKLVVDWFKSGHPFVVVHHEDLLQNPISSVKKMMNYLNITLTPERLECLRNDIEGLFHRQHSEKFHFDPFTQELHEIIDEDIRVVNELLMSRNETPIPKPAYNTEL
uniref:WSC domain-containing protein 1-like n=1 Tax=Saccoglossus kowalevskii TaxID=10224 RepID=A0ABM0MI11_SACKO|nr:PREDICTED: WSC domain-containing protein 1-like [Saccoglossus kowalevskii]